MKETLLNYYVNHNITPTRQNIDDIEVHYARRKKLYRQCGMPEITFRGAEILEVGPGGGYNTLAFFHWDCKHVDLVEANPLEIKNLKSLFKEHKIAENKYDIFETSIEKYETDRKYDIIIIEGVLTILDNQKEILDVLKKFMTEKSIIVVTCTDKIDYFIERMKKLVGIVLARDISTYDEKLAFLTDLFKPQLEKLRGGSKLPEDWVANAILSPIEQNQREWSLTQAIQYFEKDFDVLGSSPQMFVDYSWSKDIWYDYQKDYLCQFDQKRLSLLMANMQEVILPVEKTKVLVKYFEDINDMEMKYEETGDIRRISDIVDIMDSMEDLLKPFFEDQFMNVFYEIKEILLFLQSDESINMEDYPHFFAAFGRTQQYISFVKK